MRSRSGAESLSAAQRDCGAEGFEKSEMIEPKKIDGGLSAAGLRFGVVVSRFNSFITDRLMAAAVDALERAGATSKDVDVVHVPGAFELPLAAKKMAVS